MPVPIALYPLNGKYTTWDISGRSNPNGLARGVRLAPGPDGHPQGSYQFSGKSSSFIEFPNTGALKAKESITLLAWVYVKSRSGPIFNYNPLGWGVSLWVNSKHYLSAKFVEDGGSEMGGLRWGEHSKPCSDIELEITSDNDIGEETRELVKLNST